RDARGCGRTGRACPRRAVPRSRGARRPAPRARRQGPEAAARAPRSARRSGADRRRARHLARSSAQSPAGEGELMRLLELRLIAFGPFTDHAIDLSAPGLHVIYGPNEAGKSTALRAITALLFGIDERTPDAYLHPYDKLRIGAALEHGGERLEVVRSKKRKHALTDPAGAPVDEARLRRFLGGVTPALFGS